MDSDPDPGSDIRPRNGYGNDWGSKFIFESEFMQFEQVLCSTMLPLDLEFKSESVSESVSHNVIKLFRT